MYVHTYTYTYTITPWDSHSIQEPAKILLVARSTDAKTRILLFIFNHGAGEMVQMVKCLGNKHDDLNPVPSIHSKSGMLVHAWNPSTREAETRVFLGFLSSHTEAATSILSQRPCLKNKDKMIEEDTRPRPLASTCIFSIPKRNKYLNASHHGSMLKTEAIAQVSSVGQALKSLLTRMFN